MCAHTSVKEAGIHVCHSACGSRRTSWRTSVLSFHCMIYGAQMQVCRFVPSVPVPAEPTLWCNTGFRFWELPQLLAHFDSWDASFLSHNNTVVRCQIPTLRRQKRWISMSSRLARATERNPASKNLKKKKKKAEAILKYLEYLRPALLPKTKMNKDRM